MDDLTDSENGEGYYLLTKVKEQNLLWLPNKDLVVLKQGKLELVTCAETPENFGLSVFEGKVCCSGGNYTIQKISYNSFLKIKEELVEAYQDIDDMMFG